MPDKSPYPEFGSGYPYNVYLLIIIPVLLLGLGLLNQSDLIVVMMNLPIGMLIYYIAFARFSCKIEINEANEMEVIYFFPWDDNIIISLDDFENLSVEKGKYSSFFVLCFTANEQFSESVEVNVNTRMNGMNLLLRFMEKAGRLKVRRPIDKISL